MFEIGLDKLIVVGVLVGVIAGPERMLVWSRELRALLHRVRDAYRVGKTQLVAELDSAAPEWRELDPRTLDPRRILREDDQPARGGATPEAPNPTPRGDGPLPSP